MRRYRAGPGQDLFFDLVREVDWGQRVSREKDFNRFAPMFE